MSTTLFAEESFRDLNVLDERLTRQLEHLKFAKTTQVQKASIPAVLSEADCLIRSPTGSGKTLSFAVPLLQRYLSAHASLSRESGVFCIVVSPSKELSVQTQGILEQLVRMMPGIVVGCLAGGENPQKEKHRIRKGLNIVCGTPGRLLYHLENTENFKTSTSAGKTAMLVLDEADRLLDLGFEKQVRKIKEKLQQQQSLQCVMVSATLSDAVKQMAGWCLRSDKSVFVDPFVKLASSQAAREEGTQSAGGGGGEFRVASDVTQSVVEVGDERSRLLLLMGTLLEAERRGMRKVMVFLSSCASVDYHINLLTSVKFPKPPRKNTHLRVMTTREIKKANAFPDQYDPNAFRVSAGESAEAGQAATGGPAATEAEGPAILEKLKFFKLHGDLNTADRNGNISGFRKCGSSGAAATAAAGGTAVLLCTDVAARGLDISEVDLVLQYDAPQQAEEYLHRVGRTGRIGKTGNAMIFLNSSEMGFVDLLISMCSNMTKPILLEAESLVEAVKHKYKQQFPAEAVDRIRDVPTFLTSEFCKQVADSDGLLREARKAYVSTLRAYRTFQGKEMRRIFDWRNVHSGHLAKNFGIMETPKEIASKNKDTEAFKKRPHNMLTRVQGERLGDKAKTQAQAGTHKRRKLGRSTAAIANMEFGA